MLKHKEHAYLCKNAKQERWKDRGWKVYTVFVRVCLVGEKWVKNYYNTFRFYLINII
jgi:hypothetical protein